jgi:uncharacterized membrane protein YfcA
VTVLETLNPLYTVSGFGVGLVVGLTGVGGGSLMTPLLVLLFGIHPATAVGTDLLYAAVTKSAGTLMHGWRGSVEWRLVGRLLLGSLPAASLTLIGLSALDASSGGSARIISTLLGVALLLTALSLLFRRSILAFYAARVGQLGDRPTAALTIATGVVLGCLVSLTSVGAGALGVTALILLYPRLPTVRIVGSDIAHAVPLTLLGGIGHLLLGDVDWRLLVALLLGSLPGILCGSTLSNRVPEYVLRPILAATLVLVGSRLVW